MKYRKLNNGDYSFGSNANDFVNGTVAVSQAIKTNLLLLFGEWWEEKDKGLPLFQNILGQPGTPQNVQATDLLIQGVISKTKGVISIKEFQSFYDNRSYSLNCTVDTQYGPLTIADIDLIAKNKKLKWIDLKGKTWTEFTDKKWSELSI